MRCSCCRTSTRSSVYRLYDFTKAQLIRPGVACRVAGKVNSAAKLYLVIESVLPHTKHGDCSNVPVPADGVGGLPQQLTKLEGHSDPVPSGGVFARHVVTASADNMARVS